VIKNFIDARLKKNPNKGNYWNGALVMAGNKRGEDKALQVSKLGSLVTNS